VSGTVKATDEGVRRPSCPRNLNTLTNKEKKMANESYGYYVTLLINFNNNLFYDSAILSGENVHFFYGANIVNHQRN